MHYCCVGFIFDGGGASLQIVVQEAQEAGGFDYNLVSVWFPSHFVIQLYSWVGVIFDSIEGGAIHFVALTVFCMQEMLVGCGFGLY